MRDVILARRLGRRDHETPRPAHFETLYEPDRRACVPFTSCAAGPQTDVTVGGSHMFRFVNTHLEAFDNQTITPGHRRGSCVARPGLVRRDRPRCR